jgi:integrative and conjugative element protein (TIGR02256 family)
VDWTYLQAELGHVIVTRHAHAKLTRHRQLKRRATEAGGVLLGRHLLTVPDIVIDDVTEPQATDHRTRTSFFRSSAHQAIAMARWQTSDELCGHLGLWHTHPEPHPGPSGVDLADWRFALTNDRFEGETLLFVIVGQETTRVWQGWRDARRAFAELTPLAEPRT